MSGLEADESLADLEGTNTCFAFSGTFISLNCRAQTNSFGTATGRVGWVFGPYERSLVYVKGGLAWGNSNVDMITNFNGFGIGGTSSTSFNSTGWTVGANGKKIAPHIPVVAESGWRNRKRLEMLFAPSQRV